LKKSFVLAMATVIGMSAGNSLANVSYAAEVVTNASDVANNSTATAMKANEKIKAQFAYEMAMITEKIVAVPTADVENFKMEFTYAMAQVTAKVMPFVPNDQKSNFAYEMAKLSGKIITDPNLNVEKAKMEFAYEIAQLTTKIIANDSNFKGKSAWANSQIAPGITNSGNKLGINQNISTADVSQETYMKLVDEVAHIGERNSALNKKVNIDGEVLYHYAFNSGTVSGAKDSSGIRFLLGANTEIDKTWSVNGQVEIKKGLLNYNNEFNLSRLNAVGKLGTSLFTAGSFGYTMAQGNIYDSEFKGIKTEFAGTVKSTLSFGSTDNSRKTAIATAKYKDYDYNLEAGIYHYQRVTDQKENTIGTLGGNYNFNNFSIGAMYLGASLKDSKGQHIGHVYSVDYGKLREYVPGSYSVFARYYNQPLGTYIEHSMNGLGNTMQGFRGCGLGMNYAVGKNIVFDLEYYDLADNVLEQKSNTWWSQLNYYF